MRTQLSLNNINKYKIKRSPLGRTLLITYTLVYFLLEKLLDAIDEPEMNTDSTDFKRRKILNEGW
jgi:hypothetical protein